MKPSVLFVSRTARGAVLWGSVLWCLALPWAGCSKPTSGSGEPPGPPRVVVPITPEARKEAAEIFEARCATCHGKTGRGDGPAALALNPRPRDFADSTWRRLVSDAQIERIVQLGGAAVGKSSAMPPNPDLISRPAVVGALRERVRQLGAR